MTPDPQLAAMYAADWTARSDLAEFIQSVIDGAFKTGDPEELLAHGFIEGDEDTGYIGTPAASAAWVLEHWSTFEISHCLVTPSVQTLHSYTEGAVIFPLRLATESGVAFFDCEGCHFDDLPGRVFGLPCERVSTQEVVDGLRGTVDAIWFMNLTDPAHATTSIPGDTVFAYNAENVVFSLTARP